MSQVSIVDIEHNNPQIPTRFNANVGFAIPIANFLEIFGDTVPAGVVPVYTTGSGNNITTNVQISQAIAASDATRVGLAAFNSADFTVDANAFVSVSGTVGKTITGNTGGARSPTAGNWNIVTANSTPIFAGAGSTLTLDFDLTNLVLGTSTPVINVGTGNVGMGQGVMGALTDGDGNVVIGHNAALALNTGSNNVAIGYAALLPITTGTANIGLGANSAGNFTGTESSNIIIGSGGVAADNNTIRIGTQGNGTGQQNKAYMAGITGVTVAGSAPVGVDTNGQLSSLGFGTSGQLFTSNGAATSPTWQTPSASLLPWTEVTGTSQSAAINNGYILNNAGLVTVTLPSTFAVGSVIRVGGKGAGGWTVVANAGDTIHFGNQDTSAGGSLSSTNRYDSVELVAITANAEWLVLDSQGNLTVA